MPGEHAGAPHSRRASGRAAICAAVCVWLTFVTGAPAAAAECDPEHVAQSRQTILVASNGVDDTANLQCAIDAASALDDGVVQLLGGTYRTGQLVVTHLHGAIRGMGLDRTRVQNTDDPLPIDRPDGFVNDAPSPTNRYPSLISILGADVTLSDFTVVIVGDDPVAPWHLHDQPDVTLLANAIQIVGSGAAVNIERIGISGSGCYPDGNIGNGVSVWTFGEPGYVLSPVVHIADSLFSSCGGVAVESVHGGMIAVTGSVFDVGAPASGLYVGDVQDARVVADGNRFSNGQAGLVVWGSDEGRGLSTDSLLVRSNVFAGVTGVVLRGHWSAPIECAIVANNVRRTQLGYLLLPDSFGCAIVGQGPGTALDLTGGMHGIVNVTPAADLNRGLLDLLKSLR